MRFLKNFTIKHIWVEHAVSVLFFVVSTSVPGIRIEVSEPRLIEFLSAIATVAGTVMATVTFVCALLYQNITPRMRTLIEMHGEELRNSWIFIVLTSLVLSVVAVMLISFAEYTFWVSNIAVAILLLVLFSGLRAIFWLYTLMTISNIDTVRRPVIRVGSSTQ